MSPVRGKARGAQRIAALVAVLLWGVGCGEGDDRWTRPDAAGEDAGPDARTDAQSDAGGEDAQTDAGDEDAGTDAALDAEAEAGETQDGSTDAGDDAASDAAEDASLPLDWCPAEAQVDPGCLTFAPGEDEWTAGLCDDGLDNDCNGHVDDGCTCAPGAVQPCFAGPPGRAHEGACQWGTQRCNGFEFFFWGECEGGLAPTEEQCDGLDNDCNGCVDEIAECVPVVDCPAAGDPRIGRGAPFSTHGFDADRFVDPAAVKSYRWRVQGTPCDRMFQRLPGGATSTSGKLSYTLHGDRTAQPALDLTLSGQYAVSVDLELTTGDRVTCEFPFEVSAPGLRVELCWPESGPNSPSAGEVDLDLHLGRADETVEWNDDLDCHFSNCKTLTQQGKGKSLWGYPTSDVSRCTGPGASAATNQLATACYNPRLDVDSASVDDDRFPTENINVDAPGNGERFRVAVINRGCSRNPVCATRAHPLVNVYCDGTLQGSLALEAGETDDFGSGTTAGVDGAKGSRDLWRAVDIAARRSGGRLSCDLTALTAPDAQGPWIETGPEEGTLPY